MDPKPRNAQGWDQRVADGGVWMRPVAGAAVTALDASEAQLAQDRSVLR